MARYLGPKCKLSRREGTDLFLKSGVKPLESKCKLEVPPGGIKGERRGRLSDYGVQLREKQKLRRMYGVLERQFRNYYIEGCRPSGRHRREPAAAARRPPRQRRVPHGFCRDAHRSAPAGQPQGDRGQRQDGEHRRPTRCKAGDVVAVREKAQKQLRIQTALQIKSQVGFPDWVEVDEKKFTGMFKQLPDREEILPGDQREPRGRTVFEVVDP